jgi:large subunit ribosomal protein L20
MTRVKRGTIAHKRRKNVLKYTKGFRWGRKSKYKAAKEAIQHAWTYAYRDRRNKKRDIRRFWQNRINFASREMGITYSHFMQGMKKKKIEIDRKILSQIIEEKPEIFNKIAEEIKAKS